MSPSGARLQGFAGEVRRALAASGLAPPDAGEARVVLFDATPWNAFETEASALLDADERKRAARFRFERDRCTYVVAHALWRVVLAVCLERDPAELPLDFPPSGQPRLPGTPFATSLSHSGPVVLMAVGAARMLGVDVERWPPRIPLDGLLPAICAPDEASSLRALSTPERERALLQLWTRKEALLKAFGIGLAQAPAAFRVTPGEPVVPPSNLGEPPCRVTDLVLPGPRVGALAMSLDVARYCLHVPGIGGGSLGSDTPITWQTLPAPRDEVCKT